MLRRYRSYSGWLCVLMDDNMAWDSLAFHSAPLDEDELHLDNFISLIKAEYRI